MLGEYPPPRSPGWRCARSQRWAVRCWRRPAVGFLVVQDERLRGAGRRAEPVRAVDDEVDRAADARRDELVDRRVDRGVLAPDAGAGEEPADREEQERPGEGGRRRRDEV